MNKEGREYRVLPHRDQEMAVSVIVAGKPRGLEKTMGQRFSSARSNRAAPSLPSNCVRCRRRR
jgi:hypothetical protein